MATYIALLRGINVGGHRKIKMAELKHMFETMGFAQVQTYIQSGNVLFDSDERPEQFRQSIVDEIHLVFGFEVPVVLRSAVELEKIFTHCPFEVDSLAEGESVNVSFLFDIPPEEGISRLSHCNNENDEFKIIDKDVYLLFRKSIRTSKLAINLKKLGVEGTVRNWKTVTNLVNLAKSRLS